MALQPLKNLFLALFCCIFPIQGIFAATFEELNTAFEIPIWSDDNLWDDEVATTAERLRWHKESETSTDSSYRKWPESSDQVLGLRPYSLALYGEDHHPSSLSLMFINKGDAINSDLAKKDAVEYKKQVRDLKMAIGRDAKTISSTLTMLLGAPVTDRFGQGSKTQEMVQRWDWNGHAILLASPSDEYVAVRIVPLEVADSKGKSRISTDELRKRLLSRVERRPNGDVILKDMPMVNQGPKGYCVPATWERVMRYMAVPADMYVLANAGNTGIGGGTSLASIVTGAQEAIVRGGRRFESATNKKLSMLTVSQYIDKGLPIMWSMFAKGTVFDELNERMKQRQGMSDPAAWKSVLAPTRKPSRKILVDPKSPHMCMIIGYNKETGEIATSDSWGPSFAERWITIEEADKVSSKGLMVIHP